MRSILMINKNIRSYYVDIYTFSYLNHASLNKKKDRDLDTSK